MSDTYPCPNCSKELPSEEQRDQHNHITHELTRSQRLEKLFDWEPTDYQQKLLDYGVEKDKAQTAPKKGRQVGATVTAGAIGADHALIGDGTDVLYSAPSQGTANEMFRECKKLFWNAPVDDWESYFGVVNDNKETWEFADGTRILSRTLGNVEQSNNSGNRGMNPTCVIVDEADYTKDKTYTEEIRPFFITHPKYEFHLFSTPARIGGYFHDKVENQGIRDYSEALDTEHGWYSPYWPTKISPFAQADEIENAREELTEDEFAQEYLGEFRAGGNLVDPELLGKCITPNIERGSGARYLGVDPAGGGDDRMVIYDIDEHGITHNIWAWQETSGPEFLERITGIIRGSMVPEVEAGTGQTPDLGYESCVVERNGIGEYGADFVERDLGDVILPISSGRESKHTLYKRLIRDIEGQDVVLPNHSKLKSELLSLQKTTTPTGYWKVAHPSGGHDDYPDALMLANGARHGLAGEFRTGLKNASEVVRRSASARMHKGQL